jgi:hypothetical protein
MTRHKAHRIHKKQDAAVPWSHSAISWISVVLACVTITEGNIAYFSRFDPLGTVVAPIVWLEIILALGMAHASLAR